MTPPQSEKQRAFEQEAVAHADLLYRFGMSLTGNAADADDLVQETYLKAHLHWEKYNQGTNIRAWLCRILKNSFINKYRKESRGPDMVEDGEGMRQASVLDIGADENNLQKLVFDNILDDEIAGAVSELPEDFRIVVILCDIEGLKYLEVASFLDCPIGTVRSRLHRGRELLHSKLFEYAKDRGYVRSVESPVELLQCASEG